MDHANFVAAAYAVVAGGLGLYTARLLRRGRRMARLVPEGRRRWM